MRLTTKGRYAVTALLDLALHQSDERVSLAAIGDRQGISLSYLEQLFRRLRIAGIVAATKGPGGGYRLAQPADEVSVSSIVTAVGEGLDATRCGGAGDCQGGHQCLTHDLWVDLSEQIDHFLSGISLGALVKKQLERQAVQRATAREAGDRTGGSAGVSLIDTLNLN